MKPDPPVTKIWERNNRIATNSEHMFNNLTRAIHRLQGLRKNNIVKRLIGIKNQIGIRIALNDGQSFRDAVVDAFLGDFHASSVDIALRTLEATNERCGAVTGTCDAMDAAVDRSSVASVPLFGLAKLYDRGSVIEGTEMFTPVRAR